METCPLWLNLLADLLCLLVLSLRSKSSLAAENLFLRKRLAFYQERRIKPRRTSHSTRLTLLWLSRWFNWQSALTVVTPKTFIGWQRKGFQLFWRRKCQCGRPWIPPEFQRLICKMARENPSWSEERIANELLPKLGLRVSLEHRSETFLNFRRLFKIRNDFIHANVTKDMAPASRAR